MKILVAFDGSEQSYRAFDFAVDSLKMCPGAGADNHCDMVVIGPHGKSSKLETWLLGSVSKRVTSYAPCTVVIVK
jgi:nucleotide-binding universal stress UspA family protein